MSAPRFAPAGSKASKYYTSPDVVPTRWSSDRPGDVAGLQPRGARLGAQGPDQGFALTIAARISNQVILQPGERLDDAIRGCVGIALRRASIFSRAPVVHDVRMAFTMWGYFLTEPPSDLLSRRMKLFEGVGNVNHHYAEGRKIADLVPEATLRMTPDRVAAGMPGAWRNLTGA